MQHLQVVWEERQGIAQKGVRTIEARKSTARNSKSAAKSSVRAPAMSAESTRTPFCLILWGWLIVPVCAYIYIYMYVCMCVCAHVHEVRCPAGPKPRFGIWRAVGFGGTRNPIVIKVWTATSNQEEGILLQKYQSL